VRFGTPVHKVNASPGGWQVETSDDALQARFVVIATGYDHDPDLPDWPGRPGYAGELIHSSRLPQPKAVPWPRRSGVGPNVTGSEVANQLARGGAARVRVACRTVPNLVARKFLGVTVNVPGLALNHLPVTRSRRGRMADGSESCSAASTGTGSHGRPKGSRPRWCVGNKHRPTTTGSLRS